MSKARVERAAIAKMFVKAESLRDYPGSYFPILQRAQAMLAAWKCQYPIEAAEEQRANGEFAQQQKETGERDYETSFIGRGIE